MSTPTFQDVPGLLERGDAVPYHARLTRPRVHEEKEPFFAATDKDDALITPNPENLEINRPGHLPVLRSPRPCAH